MASSSDKGPAVTEASHTSLSGPLTPAFTPDSSTLAIAPKTDPDAAALLAVARSTKRPRSPSLDASGTGADTYNPELSPKKLARLASGPRFSDTTELTLNPPVQEDGSLAMEEQEQGPADGGMTFSGNGADDHAAQTALSVLRGAEALMSQRVAAETATDVVAEAAAAVAAAGNNDNDRAETTENAQTSAEATTAAAAAALAEAASDHLATAHAAAAVAAAATAVSGGAETTGGEGGGEGEGDLVQSPAQMDVDGQDQRTSALYPPSMIAAPVGAGDGHGMSASLPIPELQPKSPSSRRHKCPYCDTEFTRHHNLKSHLLTHSQEKPYRCDDCDMRFRRLHDLKRHSKLHTGEKPHICPRCDRKFARGDALARHSKGAGGCAGRRSSSGHFGAAAAAHADDSFEGTSSLAGADDSVMSGLEYGNSIDDEERRRLGLTGDPKGQQHQHGPATSTDAFTAHARTYPPIPEEQRGAGVPAVASSLYPPTVDRPPVTSTSTSSTTATTGGGSGGSGHTPSTSMSSLPISAGGTSLFSAHVIESPKLMSAAEASVQGGQGVGSQAQQIFARRADLAAHGLSSSALHLLKPGDGTSNGDTSANLFTSEQGMWTYIRTLEDKLKVQDERLKQQDERIALLEASKQEYEAQIGNLTKEINMLNGDEAANGTPGSLDMTGEGVPEHIQDSGQPIDPAIDPQIEQMEQQMEQHMEQQMEQMEQQIDPQIQQHQQQHQHHQQQVQRHIHQHHQHELHEQHIAQQTDQDVERQVEQLKQQVGQLESAVAQ